jgi:hypothetical protein
MDCKWEWLWHHLYHSPKSCLEVKSSVRKASSFRARFSTQGSLEDEAGDKTHATAMFICLNLKHRNEFMKVLREQCSMRFRSVCLPSNGQTTSTCCIVSRKVPTRKQNYLVCLHGHWTQPATPRLPILCDRVANQFRYDSVSPFAARIFLSSLYTAPLPLFVKPTDQLACMEDITKWLRLQKKPGESESSRNK